ncbi:MAG TPA: type II toxin-antitoxin system RelE/ParE family toxin [Stellaceae bacterium]
MRRRGVGRCRRESGASEDIASDNKLFTVCFVIETFRHKGLRDFWQTGRSAKLSASLVKRIRLRLDFMEAAKTLDALNQPGFDFHPLHGMPTRYSIHVNGPWCITFEWIDGRALKVDLEQYH